VPYQPGDENLNMESVATSEKTVFHFNQNRLYPIAPNPVRGPVNIGFTLSDALDVSLEIHDIQGRVVERVLGKNRFLAGEHILPWDTSHLAAGVYQAVLRTEGSVQAQKFVVP